MLRVFQKSFLGRRKSPVTSPRVSRPSKRPVQPLRQEHKPLTSQKGKRLTISKLSLQFLVVNQVKQIDRQAQSGYNEETHLKLLVTHHQNDNCRSDVAVA